MCTGWALSLLSLTLLASFCHTNRRFVRRGKTMAWHSIKSEICARTKRSFVAKQSTLFKNFLRKMPCTFTSTKRNFVGHTNRRFVNNAPCHTNRRFVWHGVKGQSKAKVLIFIVIHSISKYKTATLLC